MNTNDDAIRAAMRGDEPEEVTQADVPAEVSRLATWKAADEAKLDAEIAKREATAGAGVPVNRGAYDVDAMEPRVGGVNIDTDNIRKPKDAYLGDTIENLRKPGYTFAKGGGGTKRVGEDPNRLKLRKYMGRPWIEDEPRDTRIHTSVSQATANAIEGTGHTTSDLLFLIGLALKSGRTFADMVALANEPKAEAS